MKVEFIHAHKKMEDVLNVSDFRIKEIMGNAQRRMVKEDPHGTKAKFLEFVAEECTTTNELVLAVIAWKQITDAMQRDAILAKNRSQIIRPN